MRAFPIIPTSIMFILCIAFIILIIKNTKRWTQILMVILLFLLNERFMIPTGESKTVANNIDILFIIDNTISMNAEDYQGSQKRLDGVKTDCKRIIEKLNGARFSVITFNNDTKKLTPYTRDGNTVNETIEIIEPIYELYAKGSSLNTPKEEMEETLKHSYRSDPDRIRIVFFISDGEITDDSKLQSYASMKQYIQGGAVLGYGTSNGAIMHYKDYYYDDTNEKVLMDTSSYPYKEAISKMDESTLKEIANDLGIKYIHMDNSSNIDATIQSITNMMSSEMISSSKNSYEDIYYIFALPFLILLVIELKRMRRNMI